MAEREDLEVQVGTCAYESAEHRQNGHQHGRHSDKSLPASVGKFNGINTFEFSGGTPVLATCANCRFATASSMPSSARRRSITCGAERPKAIAEVARALTPAGDFLLMIIRVDWKTWLVSPLLAHHPSQNPEPCRALLRAS